MERSTKAEPQIYTKQDMLTMASTLVNRAFLAARAGMQYGTSRNLYEALGYETLLTFDNYWNKYVRQDIAKAIIDRPVRATWQGPLSLVESSKAKDTEFEIAWKNLDKRLGIKTCLSRVDKLTGIGRYGVLFLGFDDVENKEQFQKPVTNPRNLLYVKPFSEDSAKVTSLISNSKNDRFGMPEYYSVEFTDANGEMIATVKVHYSRVIHIVDDSLESEVYGTPRLEAVYNRLMDLEKLVGGDAEMFWRGARPGYQGVVDKDYQMTDTTKTDLQDQIDEFEHNLRRILVNEGVTLKELSQQLSDPEHHVDIQLQMISAVTGIPKRILTGSERGELASTQDTSEWKEYVQGRRDEHAEPHIVRPFVDRLIKLKILPAPAEDYRVKWVDPYSQSEKARVEVGKARAAAIREYSAYGPMALELMPPKAALHYLLGLEDEDITLIEAMQEEAMREDQMLEKIKQLITPQKQPVAQPGANGNE